MENVKEICIENLFENLKVFSKKKVCAMVKANAYGHGLNEIVTLLSDRVEMFGVANEKEGALVRKFTDKKIVVVGKTNNFELCRKHNLQVVVENESDICKALDKGLLCHLKIDCGMNRLGAKSQFELKLLNRFLEDNNVKLESISTHFPNTANKTQTKKNYQRFLSLRKNISQKTPVSFGGSGIIDYDFEFDIIRAGIGLYGYERGGLLPVLKIKSFVEKVFYVKAGENIGYGMGYRAKSGGFYGIVPVGYADGLKRGLSGRFCVLIDGKKYSAVGNICMDCFFVKLDKSVGVGQTVIVMQDANEFAKKLNTISYEVLTGFSNFRGKTKVV